MILTLSISLCTIKSSSTPTQSPFNAWKDFLEKAKEEERKKLQDCPMTCPVSQSKCV